MRSSYRLRTRLTSNHENHFHVFIQRFETFILRENNFKQKNNGHNNFTSLNVFVFPTSHQYSYSIVLLCLENKKIVCDNQGWGKFHKVSNEISFVFFKYKSVIVVAFQKSDLRKIANKNYIIIIIFRVVTH
jgi:hypothetical protein